MLHLFKVRKYSNLLVSSALDFTLDKFTKFVEKTIDYDNEEAYFIVESFGMPVTTTELPYPMVKPLLYLKQQEEVGILISGLNPI